MTSNERASDNPSSAQREGIVCLSWLGFSQACAHAYGSPTSIVKITSDLWSRPPHCSHPSTCLQPLVAPPIYFPPMSPADEFNRLSYRLTTSQGIYSGIVQVALKRRRVRRDACQFCAFRCRMCASVWKTLAT